MGKIKIRKPKPKRRKRRRLIDKKTNWRMPKAGEDAYYEMSDVPPHCGYEKKHRYNLSLGTYGVPAELIHWCIAKCKWRWGWWFKNDNSWYDNWDYEKNEAFMSFGSKREAFLFWFEIGCKHYGDDDPDDH